MSGKKQTPGDGDDAYDTSTFWSNPFAANDQQPNNNEQKTGWISSDEENYSTDDNENEFKRDAVREEFVVLLQGTARRAADQC